MLGGELEQHADDLVVHAGEAFSAAAAMAVAQQRLLGKTVAERVLALWSAEAATPPGVTRPDPFFPLTEATNEPPPLTPGGPPLFLGGNKRRGIALAAAVADGWLLPAVVSLGAPSDLEYFTGRRDALVAALEAAGRDLETFRFVAQVPTGTTAEDRSWALGQAREAVARGATDVILGMPPALGPSGVDAIARDVAIPFIERPA